jgi:hypothetical protein
VFDDSVKTLVELTLLTAQPAKKNKYYLGIVDQEISFSNLIIHRSSTNGVPI